jgi:hypothetical protein
MRLGPRAMLFLAIGDPALILGILGLSGVLHLGTALAVVLTAAGVVWNAMAVADIVWQARRGTMPKP